MRVLKLEENKFNIYVEIENLRIYITLYGGFFCHEENAYTRTHSHNSYEFHLMMDGESVLTSETSNVLLKQAQACIVAPNVIHTCTSSNSRHVKTAFCFSFEKTKKKTENDLYEKITAIFERIEGIKKINNAEQYIADLNQILKTFYSKQEFASIRLKNLFSLLIISLAEKLSSQDMSRIRTSDTRLNGDNVEKNIRCMIIEDYINCNYNTDASLKDLAQILYLSEKQTERVFKKEIGMSFKDFISKIRFEAAMHYITSTDLSTTEIAAKVGYKSYNGFYKMFLMKTGRTPGDYRKKHF